ncbi:MAG TPA: hypothetical protein VLQ93_06925 [Myxococcaceae bacterium]|nr:hypothetical protein [Myxococcaceae bacterium]
MVLVPGDVAWVEKRTREILEEEGDGSEHHFMVIPGQGRYQAIVEKGHQDVGPEMVLGDVLSRECAEPVYAIQGVDEFSYISRFMRGEESREDQEPDDLVRSLGCVNPWTVEPPRKPLTRKARRIVLIQGLSATRVLDALQKEAGQPLPAGYYRLEEAPQGLFLRDGTKELTFEDVILSQRFPLATIYSVAATPNLDFFVVSVRRGGKTEKFDWPPDESPLSPGLHEVMGERTPERILAALGIPKEWFRLPTET